MSLRPRRRRSQSPTLLMNVAVWTSFPYFGTALTFDGVVYLTQSRPMRYTSFSTVSQLAFAFAFALPLHGKALRFYFTQ